MSTRHASIAQLIVLYERMLRNARTQYELAITTGELSTALRFQREIARISGILLHLYEGKQSK